MKSNTRYGVENHSYKHTSCAVLTESGRLPATAGAFTTLVPFGSALPHESALSAHVAAELMVRGPARQAGPMASAAMAAMAQPPMAGQGLGKGVLAPTLGGTTPYPVLHV